MTGKVVGLKGATPGQIQAIDEGVVEELEDLLRLARDGQIQGIVYSVVKPSGIGTSWAGKADRHLMIAGVVILQNRILNSVEWD